MTPEQNQYLDQLIRAACPNIDGVAVGDPADKTTWPTKDSWCRIDFTADATAAQKRAAQQVVAAFDTSAAPPAPVPETITDRQFAHGLWKRGTWTFNEALAFVTVGTIPASLQTLLDGLPDSSRQDVTLLICGNKDFHRHHPATEALMRLFGMNDAAGDDFWRFCAAQ